MKVDRMGGWGAGAEESRRAGGWFAFTCRGESDGGSECGKGGLIIDISSV